MVLAFTYIGGGIMICMEGQRDVFVRSELYSCTEEMRGSNIE
jgi:hypothetical protein